MKCKGLTGNCNDQVKNLWKLIIPRTDVQKVMKQFSPIPYNIYSNIAPSTQCRVREAGHILGSVSIELTVEENGKKKDSHFFW